MSIKLAVKPEGRPGLWLANKRNVALWLAKQKFKGGVIHNFIGGNIMIGADWPVKSVIAEVKKCERLAIATGEAQRGNMGHALAVISGNRLLLFDIGKITEDDLAKGTS